MDLELKGRAALVTGASAGIGAGIAECLAREGARVAIAGRNTAALDVLAKKLAAFGATPPIVIAADITQAADVARLAKEAEGGLGHVDILINNAGGSRPLKGEETDAFWDEAITLNFSAARRLARPLIHGMKARKFGRIINITGAINGKTINGAGPAKAALLTWSRQLAFELGPFGITVNCIAPGRINSVQILEKLHPTEASRQAYIRDNIPAGRFGEPVELGHLAAFLASPIAAYISGAHIPFDGGAVRIAI